MCSNYIQLYLISIFILQSIRLGPNIVCNDQLNRARVSGFSRLMSAISISQRKCKRLSNMDHVLGSYSPTIIRLLEDVSIDRHLQQKCCLFRIGYIDGIKRILYENIVFLRNVESSLYRDATRFLVQTE